VVSQELLTFMLADSAITYSAKKQAMITHSTTEAEFVAESNAARETI
jgi:hypothetical protein